VTAEEDNTEVAKVLPGKGSIMTTTAINERKSNS
jgi:hypothetical protein